MCIQTLYLYTCSHPAHPTPFLTYRCPFTPPHHPSCLKPPSPSPQSLSTPRSTALTGPFPHLLHNTTTSPITTRHLTLNTPCLTCENRLRLRRARQGKTGPGAAATQTQTQTQTPLSDFTPAYPSLITREQVDERVEWEVEAMACCMEWEGCEGIWEDKDKKNKNRRKGKGLRVRFEDDENGNEEEGDVSPKTPPAAGRKTILKVEDIDGGEVSPRTRSHAGKGNGKGKGREKWRASLRKLKDGKCRGLGRRLNLKGEREMKTGKGKEKEKDERKEKDAGDDVVVHRWAL